MRFGPGARIRMVMGRNTMTTDGAMLGSGLDQDLPRLPIASAGGVTTRCFGFAAVA